MAKKRELREKLRRLQDELDALGKTAHPQQAENLRAQIDRVKARIAALGSEEADDGEPTGNERTDSDTKPGNEMDEKTGEQENTGDTGGNTTTTTGASALYEILAAYGIDPTVFEDLISQAITEQWGGQTLIAKILQDPRFQQQFPGIETLIPQFGAQSLSRWQGLAQSYRGVLKDMGAESLFALDKRTLGMLITGDTSPEEFAARVEGFKKYKEDPAFAARLDALAVEGGLGPMGVAGTIDFLAGLADPQLYDLYEGVELMQYGSLDAQTAHKLSRALGKPGEQGNVIDLVDVLSSWNDKAMSELRSAGITQEQLVRGALQPQFQGSERERANNDFLAVQQILRNRQARLQAQPGTATQLTRGRPVTQGDALLQSVG